MSKISKTETKDMKDMKEDEDRMRKEKKVEKEEEKDEERVKKAEETDERVKKEKKAEKEDKMGLEVAECKRNGYRLFPSELLGEGGYAKVFLAKPRRSKITDNPKLKSLYENCTDKKQFRVAIKIVDLEKVSKHYLEKYLPREISSLSQCCDHPNVVELVEFFATGNRVYIVLEQALDGDCHDFVNKHGGILENGELVLMGEEMAKRIFRQMVAGVNHMHANGVAHRDLKLENILITNENMVKISDFGFAVKSEEEELRRTHCGSRAYTAPEILRKKDYDGRIADIWSLGVLLFILVQGTYPFKAGTAKGVLTKMQQKRSLKVKVSRECRDLVKKILKMDPEKRPTCSEILKHPWLNWENACDGDHIFSPTYTHVPCKLDDPERIARYMKKVARIHKKRVERKENKENLQGDSPANTPPLAQKPITDNGAQRTVTKKKVKDLGGEKTSKESQEKEKERKKKLRKERSKRKEETSDRACSDRATSPNKTALTKMAWGESLDKSVVMKPSAQPPSATKSKVVVKNKYREGQQLHKKPTTTTTKQQQLATAEKCSIPPHIEQKITTLLATTTPQHKQQRTTTKKNKPIATNNEPRNDSFERMLKWVKDVENWRPHHNEPPPSPLVVVVNHSSLLCSLVANQPER